MNAIGFLNRTDDGFAFRYDELNLTIRGAHAEWVLEAASELIRDATRLEAECRLEDLTVLVENGDAKTESMDEDRQAFASRFERVPQCVVTMGTLDYRWVSNVAGSPRKDQSLKSAKPTQTKHHAPLVDTEAG